MEALGTAILVATVVGSGIMAAAGTSRSRSLGNTIPTGAILVVLILALAPISGAHFNPAVSLMMAINGRLRWRAWRVSAAQLIGGLLGTLAAHGMFELPRLQIATTARTGRRAVGFAEFVATFGLLITILALVRFRVEAVAIGVGLYITAVLVVYGLDLVSTRA